MGGDIAAVAGWVREARAITVLSGAGLSTDSGIPDFRGPNGEWTRDPEAQRLVTLAAYVEDSEVRRRAWRERLDHPAWSAEPGRGHRALVELERAGKLRAILTQNIDGLQQAAGSDEDLVVELHGTLHWVVCLACGSRTPMPEALDRVRSGEADPPCLACGGIQKSATISFGQALDPGVLAAAVAAAGSCDLFLVIGSSLVVQPAASLCDVAKDAGARLAIVNAQPTPYDAVADAAVRGMIAEVVPRLVAGSGG